MLIKHLVKMLWRESRGGWTPSSTEGVGFLLAGCSLYGVLRTRRSGNGLPAAVTTA